MFTKFRVRKANYGTFRLLSTILVLSFVFSVMVPTVSSTEILGIDISVSPNPIPCGGEATVTVTIKRAASTGPQLRGVAKLWDVDSWFRNGDDLLDQEDVWLLDEETTVTFTIRCEIKEGGCDLYGPSGNSGESGTDIFVSFYDHKSAEIYVKCEQYDVDGEVSLNGSSTVIEGDETSVIMSAERPIENVTTAQWGITYDSSVLEVTNIDIINPELILKKELGLLTYDTIIEPSVLSFNLDSFEPMVLEGDLLVISFMAKSDSPKIWDTTAVKCKEDSVFNNTLGDEIDVCLGGNHSIFIAPNDTTAPVIDANIISFSQGKIVGSVGSVNDDDWGDLEKYLTVTLYNENGKLVAEDFANEDGSFQLDNFFWLSDETQSTIVVYNGINLSDSHTFIPPRSCIPYTIDIENKTGKPGEQVGALFHVQGRCDSSETYSFTVSDTNGWEVEQSEFEMIFEPMEDKVITINVTIPTNAQNGTTNSITLTMTSTSYPEISNTASTYVSVFGEYEDIQPDTNGDTVQDDDHSGTEKTPSFELILVVCALTLVVFWKRKTK